jgi:DNA-binding transcriptional ArsR family regulator
MPLVNDIGAALSDETRLHVLQVAASGVSTPTAIAKATGYSPSTISFHLGRLERAGLVERRYRGRERLVMVRHDRLRMLLTAIEAFNQRPE